MKAQALTGPKKRRLVDQSKQITGPKARRAIAEFQHARRGNRDNWQNASMTQPQMVYQTPDGKIVETLDYEETQRVLFTADSKIKNQLVHKDVGKA